MKIWLLIVLASVGLAQGDDWPQWLGPQRDSVWRETGILEKFPAAGPKIRWRTPVGMGYAGPAVADGRVYVMDRTLDDGTKNPANAFDRKTTVPGTERLLCLNEADGKVIWKQEYACAYAVSYPAGPRATPLVSGGKVYTLGTEGDLCCFDAVKGDPLWKHELKKDYDVVTPMWGFAASPLIDGQKLICLARGNGSTVVAFDKDTGKEIWKALSAQEPGYCPPVIYEAGGVRQLIVWHPEAVNSLNPETGEVYWTKKFTARAGLSVPMPRLIPQPDKSALLFITSFYNGAMLLKLAADKPAISAEIWRGKANSEMNTDTLHSIIPTPFIEDGYIYGVCSYGQFRCLKLETGERQWESFIPTGGPYPKPEGVRWANAFIIKNGGRFFLSNEKGDLIIAKLSPKGYEEISRAHLLEPTNTSAGRPVVWSHPAFANKCVYARNDKEIICASLAE